MTSKGQKGKFRLTRGKAEAKKLMERAKQLTGWKSVIVTRNRHHGGYTVVSLETGEHRYFSLKEWQDG